MAQEINSSAWLSDANLKAYYRFSTGALTTDSSGEGHTLTTIGVPAEGTGRFTGGVDLGLHTDISIGDSTFYTLFLTYYWRDQVFTAGANNLTSIDVLLKKLGSPTGDMTFEIQSDTAGAPSGTVLATATLDVATLTTSYDTYNILLNTPLTIGAIYHACLKGQAAWDASNDVYWARHDGTGYDANHYGGGNFGSSHTTTVHYLKTYYSDAYSATTHADFQPTGAFSFGLWFKTSISGVEQSLFQSYSQNANVAGIKLNYNTTLGLDFVSGKNTGTSNGTDYARVSMTGPDYSDGAWHFVVCTWDTAKLHMYIDGAEYGTGTTWANAPAYAATSYVRLGVRNNAGTNMTGNFFTGSLDDVFLINGTALSAADILQLYNTSVTTVADIQSSAYATLTPTVAVTRNVSIVATLQSFVSATIAVVVSAVRNVTIAATLMASAFASLTLAVTVGATTDISTDVALQSVSFDTIAPVISTTSNVTTSIPIQSSNFGTLDPTVTATTVINVNIFPTIQNELVVDIPEPTVTAAVNIAIDSSINSGTFIDVEPSVSVTRNVSVSPVIISGSLDVIQPSVVTIDTEEIDVIISSASFQILEPTIEVHTNISSTPTIQSSSLTTLEPIISTVRQATISPTIQSGTFNTTQPSLTLNDSEEINVGIISVASSLLNPITSVTRNVSSPSGIQSIIVSLIDPEVVINKEVDATIMSVESVLLDPIVFAEVKGSKNLSDYIKVSNNTTSYEPIDKNTTSFTGVVKVSTSYSDTTKNLTGYIGDIANYQGITLDDDTITLGDISVYLNGYTTDPPPNQLNKKSQTNYEEKKSS